MIRAYPARADEPLVAVEIPHIALVEITPDEALDLADALTDGRPHRRRPVVRDGVRDARLLLPPTRRRGRHVRPARLRRPT